MLVSLIWFAAAASHVVSPDAAVATPLASAMPAATAVSEERTGSGERTALAPPRRLVPEHVLVKVAAIDAELWRAADAGDAKARARAEQVVARLAEGVATELTFIRALPLGWALLRAAGLSEEATEHVVASLAKLPEVSGAATDNWNRALRTSNDEYLPYQWHLDAIGVEGAWDRTQGMSAQRVAVIDSGTFLAHAELAGRDANGFDFVSNSSFSRDGDGRDADYGDPGDGNCQGSGEPDSFHGTHVAGVILANSNNSSGIAGINWNAGLVTVRALGQCGGSDVDILEGLAWLGGEPITGVPALPAQDRPSVANLSLGSSSYCNQFSEDVLAFAASRGVVPIIATGNDGGPVNSPANCPSAIAVAAYGPSGDLAGYSSFGSEVDIVAPGGDQEAFGRQEDGVLSLYSTQLNPPYIFYQGTSMAAPHVTGVVSLLQALDSTIGRDEVLGLFGSVGAGSCDGCSNKPVLRADLLVAEVAGSVSTNPGDPCLADLCGAGQACVLDVCRLACVTADDCGVAETCSSGGCVPDGGGGGGGATCDEARGNMDCPSGFGCVDGSCEEGEDDGDNVGALCERDHDCATGLCERGVCTVTCDDDGGDCRDGFECDEDRVPGGLCVPESCKDEDEDFCERDWSCSYSSTSNYVCAYGPSNFGCSHLGSLAGRVSSAASSPPVGLYALLSLMPLWLRRRSRR